MGTSIISFQTGGHLEIVSVALKKKKNFVLELEETRHSDQVGLRLR